MNIKNFFKPTIAKALLFLGISILLIYFTKENACGISLFFTFCYNALGFPFLFVVAGQIDAASGYIHTLPLGSFFGKYGNYLFNAPAFILDAVLIYAASCLISFIIINLKIKFKKSKKK